jgi:putative ABC transport system substrate-binding protein
VNSYSDNRKSKIKNPKWCWGFAIAVWLTICGAAIEAEQPAKVPTIGFLLPDTAASSIGMKVLQRELHALSYIEGKNIRFELRFADNKLDPLPALAEGLVRLQVDVLVVGTTPPALALKNATRMIPIVFFNVADPVGAGLIDSLARPGGNITGVTNIASELAGKRLELLKEAIPKLSSVAVLWNPRNAGSAQQWNESQLAARELGLQVHSMEVSSTDKFGSAFKEVIKTRSRALAVTGEPLYVSNRKQIVDLAMKNRLPAIFHRGEFVDNGGLMSYGPDLAEGFKRVAVMVDRILKGTKPADIPVEQPTKFELVVNLKTAKALGITIPPVVLARATRVVK